jgi:hypothetical protein
MQHEGRITQMDQAVGRAFAARGCSACVHISEAPSFQVAPLTRAAPA